MTIQILPDKIKIGDYSLEENETGLLFTGVVRAINTERPIIQNIAGIVAGGATAFPISQLNSTNSVEKFPFATDTYSGGSSTLENKVLDGAGQSSQENAYVTTNTVVNLTTYQIQKFPFITLASSSDVGDLSTERHESSGQSSYTHGYTSGGRIPPSTASLVIDKFPFFSDSNASFVGSLNAGRIESSGQSSAKYGYGYASGGISGGAYVSYYSSIYKFSFQNDGNSTFIGNLTTVGFGASGQSSDLHGYASGRLWPSGSPALRNHIDKFPFAVDANATDVGDLTTGLFESSGQSSLENGYVSGGETSPSTLTDVIQKFPFATDANASNVGNLSGGLSSSTGHQY